MLGYDARVHEIRSGVGDEEFLRISQLPYAEGIDYFKTLFSRSVAYVPYRTWVDGLLKAVDAGRARMLHGGGYPYLFHASGAEIKANFAGDGVEAISGLSDETWYAVEAWDQS
jgi:hypothetical protein